MVTLINSQRTSDSTKQQNRYGYVVRSVKPPSLTERNTMVEKYLPLVRAIAADVCAGTSANVEYDDLVSAGVFGLIDSVKSFDKGRGVKFSTYCKRRIRGAMLDELRQLDWVPRWTRQKNNMLKRAERILESKLSRKPSDEEMAEEMGMDQSEFQKIRQDSDVVGFVSMSHAFKQSDDDDYKQDTLEDVKAMDPVVELQKKDSREFITRSLSRLEKMVVTLYYYEQLTMQQIGRILDISESRVSQIHTDILKRLKTRIAQDKERFLLAV